MIVCLKAGSHAPCFLLTLKMFYIKAFGKKSAQNTYNSAGKGKVGEVHESGRSYRNGVRENQFLNIFDGDVIDDIHGDMSLEQAASFLLNASKKAYLNEDAQFFAAAAVASSLESHWSSIGRRTPQNLHNFVLQVIRQSPANKPERTKFLEVIAACSMTQESTSSRSTDGFSPNDAVVIDDDDANTTNTGGIMELILGASGADEYKMGLNDAEDRGGYGADGGRAENSAEGRSNAAMMTHLKMVAQGVSNSHRFQGDVARESKRLPRLDHEHLHFLSREIETAPTYVRGVDAVDYKP